MPDIRLVALDLDGTVFNDEKEITPRTLEAIRAAIAKGVDVIPATGRVASGVPEAFLRIPGVRYALTSNGASVVELSTGKPLVNLPLDAALASDIYDIVAAMGGAMSIFIGGKAYTDYFGANDGLALMPPALRRYLRDSRIVVDEKMQTTVPGLYAAGDCTGGLLQVAKAVYEGAQAGTEAAKALRKG